MTRTVITFGTFDVFHVGHLRVVERAASLGDRLVVGVSADALNERKKGRSPVYSQAERMEIVAALRRTASGAFRVDDAVTLEALAALAPAERAARVVGLARLLAGLPRAELDALQEARFRNGQTLKDFSGNGLRAVFGADGGVVGLGEAGAGALRPRRLVAAASQAADIHPKTL